MVARSLLRIGAALLVLAPISASANGRIGSLPIGRYLCELPGDATGPASRPVKNLWFDVTNATSYVSDGGRGTYLVTGDSVVFTRGPMRGARFERTGPRALRRVDLEGPMARLRCVRTGRAD